MDASTGNEHRPTVAMGDMPEPAAGVLRMSAVDDDQANQQHELVCNVEQFSLSVVGSGVSNVDKSSRLSQPSWLLGAL